MTILLRILAFLGRSRARLARIEERSRCVVMTEALAERWRLMGVPEFAEELRDLAVRMRLGR